MGIREEISQFEQEIVQIQKRIVENASLREKAGKALGEQLAEVKRIEASPPEDPRARIEREREDLQAEIAINPSKMSQLGAFEKNAEKEIKEFEAQSRKAKVPPHVEAAIAGLKRKIATLDQEKKTLRAERDRLWVAYLHTLAEQAGEEYVRRARTAADLMIRVVNCGALIHRIEGVPNEIGLGFREFNVPPLGTESTRIPPTADKFAGIETNLINLASDANLAAWVDPAEAALLEGFKKAGLDFPPERKTSTEIPLEKKAPGAGSRGVLTTVVGGRIPVGTPINIARPEDDPRPVQAITEPE